MLPCHFIGNPGGRLQRPRNDESLHGETTLSSFAPREAGALILVVVNLLLFFRLVGGQWETLEQIKTLVDWILPLGGAAIFLGMQERISRWFNYYVVVFFVLVLLNLPLYGIAFDIDPREATIYVGDSKKEFPSTKRCCLYLRSLNLKIHEDPYRIEEVTIRGAEVFFSFWGLRVREVKLKATIDIKLDEWPVTVFVNGITVLTVEGERTDEEIGLSGRINIVSCLAEKWQRWTTVKLPEGPLVVDCQKPEPIQCGGASNLWDEPRHTGLRCFAPT
jgi:hypothetical protein